jgi:predicted DNA-binding transcriptional regulator AlpA
MTTKTKKVEAHFEESHDENGEQLLTKKQVSSKLKISCRSIDRKIAQGEFPRGFKIGSSLVRWRLSIIDQWIEKNCPSHGRARS